jgi:hypothetical protein
MPHAETAKAPRVSRARKELRAQVDDLAREVLGCLGVLGKLEADKAGAVSFRFFLKARGGTSELLRLGLDAEGALTWQRTVFSQSAPVDARHKMAHLRLLRDALQCFLVENQSSLIRKYRDMQDVPVLRRTRRRR